MVDWIRTDVGIYQQNGFTDLPWLSHWPHEQELWDVTDPRERMDRYVAQGCHSDYGSADTIRQVLDTYPDLETSPRQYLLTYQILTPQDNPGWRWCKNGPYLGTGNPQHEHLGDETTIDQILSWEVWEVRPDAASLRGAWKDDLADWLEQRMAGHLAPAPGL